MKNTIENLPKLLENKIFNLAKDYAENKASEMKKEIEKYEKLINKKEESSKTLEEIKKNEPKRKFLLEENNRNVKNKIFDLDSETKKKFREDFNQMLTEENIVKIMSAIIFNKKIIIFNLIFSFFFFSSSSILFIFSNFIEQKYMVVILNNNQINGILKKILSNILSKT